MPRARAEPSSISNWDVTTSASQTDVILPQRVDAYWHCCLLSTTVIDKPRATDEMSEMACDAVDPDEIESEAVYYTQGSDADESANRDPWQRDSLGVSMQMMSEETMRTPMTLPAGRLNLTPIHSTSDSAMFDFHDLEARSPSEASGEVPIDYRGEDAHERFRIAELKIVQENVRKIEAVDGDDDDGDCPYFDGQFSDSEDENSTNMS